MFGISFPELLVIMVIALVVFGPEKLPEMAHSIGKLMGELKKSSDSLRKEFYNSVYTPAEDLKKRIDLEARTLSPVSELAALGKELTKDLSQLNPICPDTIRIKMEQEKMEMQKKATEELARKIITDPLAADTSTDVTTKPEIKTDKEKDPQ